MIVKLKKFLIYGIKKDVFNFFKKAQKEGFIEFLSESKIKAFPQDLKKYLDAIKILKKMPFKKEKKVLYKESICDHILKISSDIENLKEDKKFIEENIRKAEPFGDFDKKDIFYIQEKGNRIFQFFCKKASKKRDYKNFEDLIYITTEYDLDYFVYIGKTKKSFHKFIELEFEDSLSVLQKKLKSIETAIELEEKKLKSFVIYLDALKKDLLNKINAYHLDFFQNSSKKSLEDKLFSIEAWVPEDKVKNLIKLVDNLHVTYEELKISKKERVPTYFENNDFIMLGEDLVKIYDIPSTKDKDPSMWVLFAFSLFFAMIISDAGYGFIYFLIALFFKLKIKKPKASIKRFINLVFLLSFSCMFWGIITTSFFGIDISYKNPLNKVSVLTYLIEKKVDYHLNNKDDVYTEWVKKYPKIKSAANAKEFLSLAKEKKGKKEVFEAKNVFSGNILMEFSIFIGMIHITISFLRNAKRNIAGIGWVIFMFGGYLFLPKFLDATTFFNFLNIFPKEIAFSIGKILLFSGIIIAVVLSLIQNRMGGIKEITKLVGVFGDVLSYLRLYALGVAGMILSQTFNDIGSYANIFIAIFIIIIGHSINMALGIISGIIHGLRLNFLEWYNHCFQGGGKLFKPLKIINEEKK